MTVGGAGISVVLLAGITYLSSAMMNRPMRDIQHALTFLNNHDFSTRFKVELGDQYDGVFSEINGIKEIVSKDFVGFNSMAGEMGTFTDNLSDISSGMFKTSDEISGIVSQLAAAATSQAKETEESIYMVNENIQEVRSIAEEESTNKNDLESSVEQIEKSFKNVEKTVKEIEGVLLKSKKEIP